MLIKYNPGLISNDPDYFDSYIVSSLKSIFHDNLMKIFNRLHSELNWDILVPYQSRIERQIFPALIIAYEYNNNIAEDFCYNFIRGYTIPLLYLDQLLDLNSEVNKKHLTEVYNLIYSSHYLMINLPNWCNVVKRISYNHFLETQQTLLEFINRFSFPNNLEQFMSIPNCYLFPSVTGGILESYGIYISDQLERMLNLFSFLRQISDEICDIEEDLNNGIITLPVIYTLLENDIKFFIKKYWMNELPFSKIEGYIIESNAYVKCYDKFMSIYRECQSLKKQLANNYNFIENLFILYDLKLCLLYRLKNNYWRDNKKNY